MTTTTSSTSSTDEAELARLIKRATEGRSWCSTRPLTIARYLLARGVTLPTEEEQS